MAASGTENKLSELALVETWRQRIQSEIDAQVRYAKEWGSLEGEDRRMPETLEEQIAEKKRELAE